MKKLLAVCLTAALTVGMLAGCGGSDKGGSEGGSDDSGKGIQGNAGNRKTFRIKRKDGSAAVVADPSLYQSDIFLSVFGESEE